VSEVKEKQTKNMLLLDGVALAGLLEKNTFLEKLELEGNNLGPKTAAAFGGALKVNKTLRSDVKL
jgi:hypothetical protein